MAPKPHEREPPADGILRPLAGWALGPGAWTAHDSLSDMLVSWAGRADVDWMLHLLTLVLLAAAAAGGLVSWQSFSRLRTRSGSNERARSRRSLALGGAIIAAPSFLGIAIEAAGYEPGFTYRYGASAPGLLMQTT